ncbi:hypothetical protein [Roseibium sp. M-1]
MAVAVLAVAGASGLLVLGAPIASRAAGLPVVAAHEAPLTLFDTGLYSNPATLTVDPDHFAFAPRYPLWTDGAEKRRWISVPMEAVIDAADPDAWDFPVGTRFWKEFSFAGHKVETRYMERRPDGNWLYATYAWNDDGSEARIVSPKGRKGSFPLENGRAHDIPSLMDCRACHASAPVAVLGFSARQLAGGLFTEGSAAPAALSPDQALAALQARGQIKDFDQLQVTAASPLRTDLERAALGYLHGNCGHCHNSTGPLAALGLNLFQSAAGPEAGVLSSLVGQRLKSPPPGLAENTTLRIAAGQPERSAVPQRMASRAPALQMPPLGTALVDERAVTTIRRWITEMETVSPGPRRQTGETE